MSGLPSTINRFNLQTGQFDGLPVPERRLSDLRGYFADSRAFERLAAGENPLLYNVAVDETTQGEGQLNYGVGVLMAGRVGAEYFMTKGHFHAWRQAAEVYIGLSGNGLMLLEEETSSEERLLPLEAGCVVNVPGFTAHRTINIGSVPLVYIAVYPAGAGHDYGVIAKRNFRSVVVDVNGRATLIRRETYLATLQKDA